MKMISEGDMTTRLDFMRPLNPAPEPPDSPWCIPFEFGPVEKGTRISISKAKEIAAELRASIAEAEYRQLRKAFDNEVERGNTLCTQFTEASNARLDALAEVERLKQKLRARGRKKGG